VEHGRQHQRVDHNVADAVEEVPDVHEVVRKLDEMDQTNSAMQKKTKKGK
jgi:hypothetical protein